MAPSPFRRSGRGDGGRSPGQPLDRVPLLALLDPDLRGRVRRKLAQRRISTGRVLFRQGEVAVLSGR